MNARSFLHTGRLHHKEESVVRRHFEPLEHAAALRLRRETEPCHEQAGFACVKVSPAAEWASPCPAFAVAKCATAEARWTSSRRSCRDPRLSVPEGRTRSQPVAGRFWERCPPSPTSGTPPVPFWRAAGFAPDNRTAARSAICWASRRVASRRSPDGGT